MKSTRELTGIKCERQACDQGLYTCGRCQGIIDQKIWDNMSQKDKAYDNYIMSERSRCDEGCSCHIDPPCYSCVNKSGDENEY